jgi:TatD DNase family protein
VVDPGEPQAPDEPPVQEAEVEHPRGSVPDDAGAVDSHCHLFLMDEEAAAVVSAAKEAGVGRMVCVGIDPETSRRAAELAQSFRGVFATAGMHPHTASDFDRRAGSVIEELLADPMVVGVGETGLDYYRRLSPVGDQHRAFRTHIGLSRESGKPLVVHVREAWEDAMRILEEEGAERVVLHCFSGDERLAAEAESRGYFVSFAGNLTYPKTEDLRRAAGSISADRILVETDSPFLTPQSRRGSDNHPAYVLETLRTLSEVRNLDLHGMVARTTANALAAFPLIR